MRLDEQAQNVRCGEQPEDDTSDDDVGPHLMALPDRPIAYSLPALFPIAHNALAVLMKIWPSEIAGELSV